MISNRECWSLCINGLDTEIRSMKFVLRLCRCEGSIAFLCLLLLDCLVFVPNIVGKLFFKIREILFLKKVCRSCFTRNATRQLWQAVLDLFSTYITPFLLSAVPPHGARRVPPRGGAVGAGGARARGRGRGGAAHRAGRGHRRPRRRGVRHQGLHASIPG